MHHQDRNAHTRGFRFDNRDLSRKTFNALPMLRVLTAVMAVLLVLGSIGVHP